MICIAHHRGAAYLEHHTTGVNAKTLDIQKQRQNGLQALVGRSICSEDSLSKRQTADNML